MVPPIRNTDEISETHRAVYGHTTDGGPLLRSGVLPPLPVSMVFPPFMLGYRYFIPFGGSCQPWERVGNGVKWKEESRAFYGNLPKIPGISGENPPAGAGLPGTPGEAPRKRGKTKLFVKIRISRFRPLLSVVAAQEKMKIPEEKGKRLPKKFFSAPENGWIFCIKTLKNG